MRIPGRIPYPLLRRAVATDYRDETGEGYDYSIGALAYVSGATRDNPLIVKSVPLEDREFVAADGPLERTLGQWWLQGQASWHAGAGQAYRDAPGAEGQPGSPNAVRYALSFGVDPWTQGELSLLPQARRRQAQTGAPLYVTSDRVGPKPVLIVNDMASITLHVLTDAAADVWAPPVTRTDPAWGQVYMTVPVAGVLWFVTSNGVWRIPLDPFATATAVKVYAWTPPAGIKPRLMFARERLIALGYVGLGANGFQAALYELDQSKEAATELPAPIYKFPTPGMLWVDGCDGPSGFYTVTQSGAKGFIHLWTLTSANPPVIGAPLQMAELPWGEIPTGIDSYLGSMLGITTSNGLRVAEIGSDGALALGPNLVDREYGKVGANAFGYDRFLFAGFTHTNGAAGLLRVDLSMPLVSQQVAYQPAQRYAWAPDLAAYDDTEKPVNGSTIEVSAIAGRLVFSVSGQGVYVQSNRLVPDGTLTSSAVRYGTLEEKRLRFARVTGRGVTGRLEAYLSTGDPPGRLLIGLDLSKDRDSGDIPLYEPAAQAFRVTLVLVREPGSTTLGPVAVSWQLKASPAQPRQVYFVLPLLLYDREIDSQGQEVQRNGAALERLLALRNANRTGEAVRFKVLHHHQEQRYTAMVTVEDLQFVQPDSPRIDSAWGGVVNVTLKTAE
ncbi:hypothetical protein [Streptomyces hydrogenans]|uniref:hypothetical protein n=1 Tax=Streptomyces hydrogenans TaxID=1873719 RepID=UPI0035E0D5B2